MTKWCGKCHVERRESKQKQYGGRLKVKILQVRSKGPTFQILQLYFCRLLVPKKNVCLTKNCIHCQTCVVKGFCLLTGVCLSVCGCEWKSASSQLWRSSRWKINDMTNRPPNRHHRVHHLAAASSSFTKSTKSCWEWRRVTNVTLWIHLSKMTKPETVTDTETRTVVNRTTARV